MAQSSIKVHFDWLRFGFARARGSAKERIEGVRVEWRILRQSVPLRAPGSWIEVPSDLPRHAGHAAGGRFTFFHLCLGARARHTQSWARFVHVGARHFHIGVLVGLGASVPSCRIAWRPREVSLRWARVCCHQPSVCGHQHSVCGYQHSVGGHQPSVCRRQPSACCHQSSACRREPSDCRQRTAARRCLLLVAQCTLSLAQCTLPSGPVYVVFGPVYSIWKSLTPSGNL